MNNRNHYFLPILLSLSTFSEPVIQDWKRIIEMIQMSQFDTIAITGDSTAKDMILSSLSGKAFLFALENQSRERTLNFMISNISGILE